LELLAVVVPTIMSAPVSNAAAKMATSTKEAATAAATKNTPATAATTIPDKRMYVITRNGNREDVRIDTITKHIESHCEGLNRDFVDPVVITLSVVKGLIAGITTRQLNKHAADTASALVTTHPDYGLLAARIAVFDLHRDTNNNFSQVISSLYHMRSKYGKPTPMIGKQYYDVVMANAARLDAAIVHKRDYNYNYFGFRTLEQSYLLRINDKVVERPQYMLMRVAIGLWPDRIDTALEAYDYMSRGFYTHATPTLYAAATVRPQLSSCFLTGIVDDSIEGIYDTLKQVALISKSAGGVGMDIHRVRCKGSYIAGTNGTSRGIVPMLRVYNTTAQYVDQGGNKRPGAFAMYLEPWHPDLVDFLDLRKNTGAEDIRARALFYALWIPDLFMRRVEAKDGVWSFMCPNECPGLADVWGEDFDKLYESYEAEGRFHSQVPARELWKDIIAAQIETGVPYMLYKDACNRKSNQQNLGTIRCSNLCTEIVQYTSPEEVAVCNLASIALSKFLVPRPKADGNGKDELQFDFDALHSVAKMVTRNLNRIIDTNLYPVKEAKYSNLRHRPIGIGVQGMADTFIQLRYPYDCDKARLLNQQIFETIYHGALEASCELAQEEGTYETYPGSPVSKGILQYDMWNKTPTDLWDWAELKAQIAKHGVRNSLMLAPMPTASTAQILGNTESFEPLTSNIYTRRVRSGEFHCVNPFLVADLVELGLWDDDMRNAIVACNGSIQDIPGIPDDLRDLYRTVWEISVRSTIQMAADRGAFIDQSQSFNIHVAAPDYPLMSSIHFFAWKSGLKTGMYYLRTKPAANPIAFTVDKSRLPMEIRQTTMRPTTKKQPTAAAKAAAAALMCSRQNPEDCSMCGA
jgi:ribonucleoside-diphosphate reductase subunit M1